VDLVKACQNSALIADFLALPRKHLFEHGPRKYDQPAVSRLFQRQDGSDAEQITFEMFLQSYKRVAREMAVQHKGALQLVKGNHTQVQHFVIYKDRFEYFADAASAQKGVGCRGRVWAHEVKAMRSTPTGFTVLIENKTIELKVLPGDNKQEWNMAFKPFISQPYLADKIKTSQQLATPTSKTAPPTVRAKSAVASRARSCERPASSVINTRVHTLSRNAGDFRVNTHSDARQASSLLHGQGTLCLSARRHGPEPTGSSVSNKINERTLYTSATPRVPDVAGKITGARSVSPRAAQREGRSWLKITQTDGMPSARRPDTTMNAEVAPKIGAHTTGSATLSASTLRRCGPGVSGKITERGRDRSTDQGTLRHSDNFTVKITDAGRQSNGWAGASHGASLDKVRPISDPVRGPSTRGGTFA